MGAGEYDVCFGNAGEGGAEFEEGGAEVLGSFWEGDDGRDGDGCVLEELRAEGGPVGAHADGLGCRISLARLALLCYTSSSEA